MRKRRKVILLMVAGLFALVVVVAGFALALAWTSIGKLPTGARLARIAASPNYRDGRFRSPVPVRAYSLADLRQMARDYSGNQQRVPAEPPPTERRHRADFAVPPASGLRITWLGHSSVLVEIDGLTVLLDPVFSERLSPFTFAGPKRFFPSSLPADEVPILDAAIISHDHYDHLDRAGILTLEPRTARFVVPLGVGSHLEYWGVPPEKIVELDWWEELRVADRLRLVACPARHFSGRGGPGDRTEWASFAIIGPRHRVFFSGDTGPMPLFAEVGNRLGPFDVTLIKIGAYGRGWPDIHVDPEQAVELHEQVRGRLLVPVHWGTVNLSYHGWTEPAERVIVAARQRGVALAIPRPGEMLEPVEPPAEPPPVQRWWPDIPWEHGPARDATADRRGHRPRTGKGLAWQ
jgi:L-ascorbate metabolism protein UlaG (beta-lactamase superfamily)